MSKKVITALTLGALLGGSIAAPLVANAVEADPWEKAANEFLANNGNKPAETPKAETPKAETPKVETPKAETPKAEAPATIDEEYVKKNIDTPTGDEAKAQEDKYLDDAEAKYKEEAKAQGKAKVPAKAGKNFKKLPKTSAVK